MVERHPHFLLIVLLIIVPFSAQAGISLEFDSRGNPISPDSSRASAGNRNTPKFSVPEGIDLRKDITYEYYPVSGKTFSEIVQSSEENGPLSKTSNRHFPSGLEWGLGLSYQFDYSYGIDDDENKAHAAIDILDIDVNFHITITLPTLLDDTTLNPIEKNLWKNYLQRLVDYEHDKAKIIRDSDAKNAALNSIRETDYLIFDYQGETSIDRSIDKFLKKETSKAGQDWIKKINDRLSEYDRITDNGRRQEMREQFFRKNPD